jgi:hypothetical protein
MIWLLGARELPQGQSLCLTKPGACFSPVSVALLWTIKRAPPSSFYFPPFCFRPPHDELHYAICANADGRPRSPTIPQRLNVHDSPPSSQHLSRWERHVYQQQPRYDCGRTSASVCWPRLRSTAPAIYPAATTTSDRAPDHWPIRAICNCAQSAAPNAVPLAAAFTSRCQLYVHR